MHEACTKLHGALSHSMDSSGILEAPDCSWTGTPSINCSGDPCPDVFERLRLVFPCGIMSLASKHLKSHCHVSTGCVWG